MVMTKFHKNVLVSSIIFLVGGTIFSILYCWSCDETYEILRIFTYAGVLCITLWKGSELSVFLGDKIVGWLDNPVLRLFLSLVLVIAITTLGFFAVYFLGMSILWKLDSAQIWANFDMGEIAGPVIITLVINLFMYGRGFLISWRQNAINLEKVKTKQMATQYESLKNQLNPHFLFNSLNALSSLVYDDQKKAVDFIRKLSEVYRYVLDQNEKEVISLEDEIRFANSYIYLQKIRFSENLVVTIEVSDRCMERVVPPLSLQLLIENAIKHNVISNDNPLHIQIKNEGIDFLTVKNNLKLRKAEDSKGIGLTNLKKRYEILSDKEVYIRKTKEFFSVRIPLLELND